MMAFIITIIICFSILSWEFICLGIVNSLTRHFLEIREVSVRRWSLIRLSVWQRFQEPLGFDVEKLSRMLLSLSGRLPKIDQSSWSSWCCLSFDWSLLFGFWIWLWSAVLELDLVVLHHFQEHHRLLDCACLEISCSFDQPCLVPWTYLLVICSSCLDQLVKPSTHMDFASSYFQFNSCPLHMDCACIIEANFGYPACFPYHPFGSSHSSASACFLASV